MPVASPTKRTSRRRRATLAPRFKFVAEPRVCAEAEEAMRRGVLGKAVAALHSEADIRTTPEIVVGHEANQRRDGADDDVERRPCSTGRELRFEVVESDSPFANGDREASAVVPSDGRRADRVIQSVVASDSGATSVDASDSVPPSLSTGFVEPPSEKHVSSRSKAASALGHAGSVPLGSMP